MGSTEQKFEEGRYLYDINVGSGSTSFKVIEVTSLLEQEFRLKR